MPEVILAEPFELTDAEIDLVTGGNVAGGLVNVQLTNTQIQVLNDAFHNVLNGLTIKDIASNNKLNVGAIIQALGGGAAILQGLA